MTYARRELPTQAAASQNKQVVLREQSVVLVVANVVPESGGTEDPKSQQPKMVRLLSATAMFSLLGALVIVLPGFTPEVQSSEVVAMAKGDRLEVRAAASNCATQIWPDFSASCLQDRGAGGKIVEARLVTARR
jgi:hypothetical protein